MFGTTPHISSFAPHCDECPLRRTGVDDPAPGGNSLPCHCQHHAICQQCGWPITDDAVLSDHQGLCAVCAWEDLTRGRPPEDRHELPALLVALGLPPDVPVTFHFLGGAELDDTWGEYRIEWSLIPDVTWTYPAVDYAIVSHPWRVQLPGWDAPHIILRWRQWRVDAPEFLERGWQRHGARWVHYWQVRATDRPPSPRRVREYAELMGERKRAGRPPEDFDAWLADELRPEITATIASGQQPDQRTLAARLGYDLMGLVKKFGKLNKQRREAGRNPIRWRRLVTDIEAAMRR